MITLGIAVTCVFVACFAASFWWYMSKPKNLPPGPMGLPFLGSALDVLNARKLRQNMERWKQRYGDVFCFYVMDKLIVVFGSLDAIQEALVKQGDVYAGRPSFSSFAPGKMNPKRGIVLAEGEQWKAHRLFAMSTLRDFGFGRTIIEPRIKDEIEHMLKQLDYGNEKPLDPSTLIKTAVLNIVSFLVFGRRFDHRNENFLKALNLASTINSSDASSFSPMILSNRYSGLLTKLPQSRRIRQKGGQLFAWIENEVSKTLQDYDPRSTEEPTNYIHAYRKEQLRRGPEDPIFTDQELKIITRQLFIAGTDAVSSVILWGIFLLAKRPQWQAKLYAEIRDNVGSTSLPSYADRIKLPLMEATIREIERLAIPNPLGFARRTTAPSTVQGYIIPEDTIAVPYLWALFNDTEVYPEPENFDPSRFLGNNSKKSVQYTHLIPFQLGKRSCPGESFARMEVFMFMVSLVMKFTLSSDDDEKHVHQNDRFGTTRHPGRFEIIAKLREI